MHSLAMKDQTWSGAVGLFLVDGSNFGRMPFLTPLMTHMGATGTRTQISQVKVQQLNHWATAARSSNKLVSNVTT